MTTPHKWVGIAEASKACGISATILRSLQKSGELPAGSAWIWVTGRQGGPLGWSIPAIQEWQVQQTLAIEGLTKAKAEAVESFSS